MQVRPRTEKEIAEMNLIPDGWYAFTVLSAENKTSKKGNEMILMKVRVYHDNGSVFVDEYLMDNEFSARKLRHLAETLDILDKYEAGGFEPEDLEGKEGWCRIGIEKSKDPQYADKNKIWDYASEVEETKRSASAPSAKAKADAASGGGIDDDSIPFMRLNPTAHGVA